MRKTAQGIGRPRRTVLQLDRSWSRGGRLRRDGPELRFRAAFSFWNRAAKRPDPPPPLEPALTTRPTKPRVEPLPEDAVPESARIDMGLAPVTHFGEITGDQQLAARLRLLYGDVDRQRCRYLWQLRN